MTGALSEDLAGTRHGLALSELPTRRLHPGARLYHEGAVADDAYYVHSGLVKMVKTAGEGFQSLIAMRGAGGFVGEHSAIDGLPRLTSAVAVTETSVAAIPRLRLLDAIREDSDFAVQILTQFAGHVRIAARHVLEPSAGDAVALVARRLTQLVSDPMFEPIQTAQEGTAIIDMPISQQELASWAGVSHRSVTGALRQLRDDGLITTSRLRLEIHDREALAERAVISASSVPNQ